MKVFGIFVTILAVAECLFEDQVGKFDWRSRHIGCPKQVELSRSAAGKDFLLVTTKKNALASLNVNSGDIDWRQVQEIDGRVAPKFAIPNSSGKNAPFVALLTNNGEYLRVFKRGNGVLLWQQRILQQAKKFNKLFVTNDLVFVISESSVMGFKATSGEKRVEKIFDNVAFAETIVNGDEKVLIVTVTGKIVKIFEIDGEPLNSVASLTLTGEVKKCIVSGSVLACLDATGSVSTVELTEKDPKVTNILSSADGALKKLSIPGYFVIRSVANIVVYNSEQGKLKELLKLPSTKIFTGKLDVESKMPLFAAYYDYERRFKLFDLTNGKEKFTTIIEPAQQASVKTIDILASGKSLQLLTVRKDCRMDLYEMIIGETTKANLEWTRFEALADISSVEMLDLPLSESQAMIETEFSGHETNMVKMLYRRITAQIEEFKRGLLAFFDRIIKSFDLWINKQVSFSIVMKNLFGDDSAIRRTKKPRPGSIVKDEDLILERDYFNLRKIIVATSYSGSIYGILSEDGSILWSLYLGDDFTVLKNQFNQKKIPLFIQRGTAHYQYKSQAIVAFGLKHSQSTRMVVFNPINGELMDTIERPKLKRIDLLPFPNDDMILPVLTVDLNDKIDFYPNFGNNYPTDRLISLFNVDGKTGEISGSKVDLKDKKIVPSWKSSLSFGKQEEVVNIVGKPNNQKVHSSGRVLGDRSVLYKYSNPNLVAVQTYDYDSSTMAIYMIDTITGQIVHTARHTKVKSPFHLVHCENWVVYTYWNEKSRRTELGVIELFEGLEQTNADHFNSLTATKKPVEVVSKSFVFSQGVSAMVASETEMGLTFRSLLIAMPFGGILELPRRIADARRPLEMTPELREEMIFPYMPEIPIATEELINYNQTVEYIHGIKTAASGLESTSLMLAYGMDMFFTRVTPSGTFDILKDDFDYALIGAVVAVLIISSFVVKRIWRQNSVKQAWA